MFKGIHRKPKAVREQYAFWSAIGITGIIALVWVVSLQYRFDTVGLPNSIVEDDQRGAFAQFFGEARTRAAAVFGAVEQDAASATSTESAADTTATSTPRPAFEFVPGTRATSSPSATTTEPREVRIQPVADRATTTQTGE